MKSTKHVVETLTVSGLEGAMSDMHTALKLAGWHAVGKLTIGQMGPAPAPALVTEVFTRERKVEVLSGKVVEVSEVAEQPATPAPATPTRGYGEPGGQPETEAGDEADVKGMAPGVPEVPRPFHVHEQVRPHATALGDEHE